MYSYNGKGRGVFDFTVERQGEYLILQWKRKKRRKWREILEETFLSFKM